MNVKEAVDTHDDVTHIRSVEDRNDAYSCSKTPSEKCRLLISLIWPVICSDDARQN